MKKILISLLVLMSCSFYVPEMYRNMTQEKIAELVMSIEQRYDIIDEWDSPAEILKSMQGDCDEYCILYLYLMNLNFGYEYEMVLSIEHGKYWHHIVKIGDMIYEPQCDRFIHIDDYKKFAKILKVYSYDEVMLRATSFYTKGVE